MSVKLQLCCCVTINSAAVSLSTLLLCHYQLCCCVTINSAAVSLSTLLQPCPRPLPLHRVGFNPRSVLPVVIDVGTNNEELRNDDM